ncbi:hypothetical protein E2C01_012597 [Portunus trituberculatus]|uniref:Uncharacterized protein n=1 Tax=Portunus trituberculatus TaxID=210409 RepID=A0A5B7DE51_PORTR|nr:hypothetical protein [Portunus trituberculatus]
MDKDFSGFREERGSMRRLINVEMELRLVECEKISAINQGLKEEIQEIKKQNDLLKATCHDYESSLRSLQDGIVDRAEDGLGENKLKELRNEWKE